MSKRKFTKRVAIKGKVVEVVTISGLGEIVGKSRNTLLRYIRNGVLPEAPFTLNGYRYYSVTLAENLKPIIENLPLHTKPPAEDLAKIQRLFNEEITKYA